MRWTVFGTGRVYSCTRRKSKAKGTPLDSPTARDMGDYHPNFTESEVKKREDSALVAPAHSSKWWACPL